MISAIGVVIPAHDEHRYLAACLASLSAAACHPALHGVRVYTVVSADACTDDTVVIAQRAGVDVVVLDARNVGAARARGSAHAIDTLAAEAWLHDQMWLAHTDADTLVPPDWLAKHLAYAAEEWACVLGAVHVDDWSPRPRGSARAYRHLATEVPENRRVHGANLGVRADAYLEAGGFPALTVSEDHALATALRDLGVPVVHAPDVTVSTSARLSTRVKGGFSDYLSALTTHSKTEPVGDVIQGSADY